MTHYFIPVEQIETCKCCDSCNQIVHTYLLSCPSCLARFVDHDDSITIDYNPVAAFSVGNKFDCPCCGIQFSIRKVGTRGIKIGEVAKP